LGWTAADVTDGWDGCAHWDAATQLGAGEDELVAAAEDRLEVGPGGDEVDTTEDDDEVEELRLAEAVEVGVVVAAATACDTTASWALTIMIAGFEDGTEVSIMLLVTVEASASSLTICVAMIVSVESGWVLAEIVTVLVWSTVWTTVVGLGACVGRGAGGGGVLFEGFPPESPPELPSTATTLYATRLWIAGSEGLRGRACMSRGKENDRTWNTICVRIMSGEMCVESGEAEESRKREAQTALESLLWRILRRTWDAGDALAIDVGDRKETAYEKTFFYLTIEIPDAWWLVSLFLACALLSGGGWGRNIFWGWKTRLALEFLAHT